MSGDLSVDANVPTDDFAAFYEASQGEAMALAWLLTRDATVCEDVVHDAYAAVLARFDAIEKPVAYLRKVIVNGVYERTRRSRREKRRLELVAATSPTSVEGPTGGLADAVMTLAIRPRTVVVLRYWADLTDVEIADLVGIRPGSVRSILSRSCATEKGHHVTTDFEHDLRDALHREAARAPQLSAGRPLAQVVDASPAHRSRRLLLAAAACSIILAGVAGLIVTQRDSNLTNVIVSDTAPDSSNGRDDVSAAPTTEPMTVPPISEVQAPTTALEPPLLPAGTVGVAIGDSRMLGAVPDLQQYGFTIDALESRQFVDGIDIVEGLAERDLLRDVVVVDLGNNGSIQQHDLDTMMTQLRDVPTVVMFTSTVERDWQAPNNTMIRALPATYPNVTLVDFEAQASDCPGDCFAADNIHLNPDGARFYAGLIADAVGLEQLSPLPATPGSTSPPVLNVETTRPTSAVITRLAIGDSLMVDAGSELSAAGFTVDAAVGRQFADVVEILAPLRADGRLGDVVVLSVAEDGPIDRATADQVMTELNDVNKVIILTSSSDHPWSTPNNALIYDLAATYPNVTLADWQNLDENCRGDCFDDDGVHLRPDGQQFYAQLIAEFANL